MRVIIKREIFYAIQHGGRIDPQTGRLIKPGDKENDRVNDRETTEEMKEKLGVSIATINRDITALKEKGVLTREGGDKGGRWIILI